jgi:peptidoglycan/xylan/chitin deacetylase (PgdA/CDA1 family)
MAAATGIIIRTLKLVISLLVWSGDWIKAVALRLAGRKPPGRAVILYYHAVPAPERKQFARQMDHLLQCAHPVPAGVVMSLEAGVTYAAVTFDDGFVSVLENALPELRERHIPATLFVPSGWLGQPPGWMHNARSPATGECVMKAEQLRAAIRDGLEIGSHTVSHPRLDQLPPDEAFRQISLSKQELEAILDAPVTSLSFPHGLFTPAIVQEAKHLGYRRVFGIQPVCIWEKLDGFCLGRVAVSPRDWPIEFALKLRGAYRWRSRGPA